MLAASINFEIEFEPIPFVEFTHAGPFHRTDVNESIGLPVIASDEAEALHRIEELDCSRRAFAGKLALRRFGALLHGDDIADDLKIGGRNLPAAIDEVEFERLAFRQAFQPGAFHGADVNEHVFAAVFTLDEAKALVGVEELYRATARADHLGRHAARSATASTAATRTAATETVATATAAETITATAEAIAAATRAATAETIATAAEAVAATEAITAHEGVEAFFTKTVTLVASPTATPSIKTHKAERTFVSPKISIR